MSFAQVQAHIGEANSFNQTQNKLQAKGFVSAFHNPGSSSEDLAVSHSDRLETEPDVNGNREGENQYIAATEFKAKREAYLLMGGSMLQLFAQYRYHSMPPTRLNELSRNDLEIYDRWAAGLYSPVADQWSDFLGVPVTASLLLFDAGLSMRARQSWKVMGGDALLLTEALALNSALNLLTRSLRIHPRPLVYNENLSPSERSAGEASGSFYSGHASAAFLGIALLADVLPRRHPNFFSAPILWVGGGLAATSVGVLRVAAGKHFPSDIVAGAVAGTFFGLGIAYLHRPDSKYQKVGVNLIPQWNGAKLVLSW